MMRKIILFLLTLLLFFPVSVFSEDTVVAKIGDRKIKASDFNRWMSYNKRSDQDANAVDNKMKASMLNQIVTGMVIAEIAREEGFDKLPDISEKMKLMINNFLTLEYLDKVVSADVKASEDEILEYYEKHKDDFKVRESVHVRHILIKTTAQDTEKEKEEARSKAHNILKELLAGADFSALASENSEDPGTKDRGGDLGFIQKGRMVSEFDKVAFSLKPGEVSDIVETRFGYHIIRVEEKREASARPVGEVRSIIENKLTRDQRRNAVDEFVRKALKDADAEIDVRALVGSDPHFGK